MSDFEEQVLKGLFKCRIHLPNVSHDGGIIGAAVSGGADSVSLLLSLCHLLKASAIPLKVITVNHYIRQDSESCGDVDFVKNLCQSLKNQGYDVEVTVCELEKGQVVSLAQKKSIGIEAAARELRYNAFDKFIEENRLKCLCLAHNKNDQLETLLMRFLQGAGVDSAAGIPQVREKYIRPLLDIERAEIESYLKQNNITWRTDSTNSDTSYLRNRIRSELVPLLNKSFSGWDKAVLTGAQKARDDSEVLSQILVLEEDQLSWDDTFYEFPRGLQIRLLLKLANNAGCSTRIPYAFLLDVCDCAKHADNYRRKVEKRFEDLCFTLSERGVSVKKCPEVKKEIVFSAIIEKSGFYETPGGRVFVPEGFNFPLRIRSFCPGDEVETADCGTKKVADVFSDWHVPEEKRQYIPVVQELKLPEQKVVCILGSSFGYKDWIVKNEKM